MDEVGRGTGMRKQVLRFFTFNLRTGDGGASELIICEYLSSLTLVTPKGKAF